MIITIAMIITISPQQFADSVKLLLQRRCLFRCFFQHTGDPPHFCFHSCCRNHGSAVAAGLAVVPLKIMLARSASPVSSRISGDVLGHGQALAGQRRLRR